MATRRRPGRWALLCTATALFAVGCSAPSSTPSPSSTSAPTRVAVGKPTPSVTETTPGRKSTTATSSEEAPASPRHTGSQGPPDVVPPPTGYSSPERVKAGTGCVPSALDIPSVGIDESVRAMGLNSQGQIYPPAHTTMWYTGSARPGENGIAVIAGHVMYDGPDNFYHLVDVRDGAIVRLRCRSGERLSLRVERTKSVRKTALQTDQTVWGGSSTPVVVLITCDPASRVVNGHHLNNFVVWTTRV